MKFYIDGPCTRSYEIKELCDKINSTNHEVINCQRNKKDCSPLRQKCKGTRYLPREVSLILDSDIFIHLSDFEHHENSFYLGVAIGKHLTKGEPFIYVIGEKNSEQYKHHVIKRIAEFDIAKGLEKVLEDFPGKEE
ncbi:hypothetical protein KY321_02085 [Candidatus Woesearchaeota archaeon]|nr:hypothetical protein [Candidatus Woesearchaeota archaeon]